MAHFVDRVAYRMAGLVWTALYAGLASRPNRPSVERTTALELTAQYDAPPAAVAA